MLCTPTGDTLYIGHFKEGRKDGLGRFYFSGGNVYFGQWKDNRMHGLGQMEFYTGTDMKGTGLLTVFTAKAPTSMKLVDTTLATFLKGSDMDRAPCETDDLVYIGNWANGQKDGEGREELKYTGHQEVYEGAFYRGEYHGEGKWI